MSLQSTVMTLSFIAAASLFGSHSAFAEEAKTDKKEADTIVKVQPGDTLSSIAEANGTDYVRVFNANDFIANPDVIDVDQQVRIPKSDEQLPDRYGEYMNGATTVQTTTVAQTSTAPAAAAPAQIATPRVTVQSSTGNTYAYGWCTWYVKSRKPGIPNNWGNAYSWTGSAQASGYATGSAPVAGAIGVAGNHVVYVESVSGGNVSISEMAYAGGVGVVHYRTVPAGSFYYIYA
jgi:surface antigen